VIVTRASGPCLLRGASAIVDLLVLLGRTHGPEARVTMTLNSLSHRDPIGSNKQQFIRYLMRHLPKVFCHLT
jgi:hypothetical protein